MSFDPKENQYQGSTFNPFVPTKRDIERTEVLASKNAGMAGLLGLFIPVIAMIYLNRGINSLKILLYVFIIGFGIGIVGHNSNEQQLNRMGKGIGFLGNIALMIESAGAVTSARERQSEAES